MKPHIVGLLAGFLLLVLSAAAQTASGGSTASQVPPLIQFSSVAADEGGNSLSGVVNITFSLYAAQQGGEPLWAETQNNVQLDPTGHYSVELGMTKPSGIPSALFTSGEARWLGVRIAEQVEQPRVLLLSVPYALKAGDAATIGGLPPSAFVLAALSPTAGTAAPGGFASSSDAPAGADVTGSGTADFVPLWTTTSNIGNSVLFQSGSGSTAKIGINNITPATTLDVKGAGTIRGILSLPATGTATATKGADSQPLNLVASAFNSTSSTAVNQTFQWQAEPAANDTASPSGTLNLLFGLGATKPSETGLHIANNGQITFATGQTFPGTGNGTITGITTASAGGLTGGGTSGTLNLALTSACAKNQVLQWTGTAWACAAVGTGTVTSVGSGAGLTGGPITGSGTLSIATGGVTNAMLATSYAQLGAANTFTTNQTVNGTVTATSSGNSIVGNTTNTTDAALVGSGIGIGTYGSASSTSGTGVEGYASAATGMTVGVFGETASTSGYGVQGGATALTGTTYGVYGAVNSPGGYGVYGQQNATTGTTAGVYGTTNSSSGYGVVGLQGGAAAPSEYPSGVFGASPSGFGVSGASSVVAVFGNASGVGTGVVGQGGAGVMGYDIVGTGLGVYGTSANIGVEGSSSNYGVQGLADNVGVYGQAYGNSIEGTFYDYGSGLWGDTGGASTYYTAVLGTADSNYAGLFVNNSPDVPPLGVSNYTETAGGSVFAATMPNTLGADTFALFGDAVCGSGFMALQLGRSGMSGCNNYTLMGDTSGDTYLNANSGGTIHLRINNGSQLNVTSGNVDVIGTLSKGGGSFKIDHPLDPANKYLYHSFVESPDMKNMYDGNVTTDGAGQATVTLPDWFETLNRDFRYQLTVIGQFAQAIVASEISGNQFSIRTDKPNVKVSWQVTGVRQDAFANAHRIQVEVEKAPADRGHYLYPELVGAPETERIGYMAVPPGSENVGHHPLVLPRRRNASRPQTPLSNAVPRMPVLPSVAPPVPKIPSMPKPPIRAAAQPVTVQPK